MHAPWISRDFLVHLPQDIIDFPILEPLTQRLQGLTFLSFRPKTGTPLGNFWQSYPPPELKNRGILALRAKKLRRIEFQKMTP